MKGISGTHFWKSRKQPNSKAFMGPYQINKTWLYFCPTDRPPKATGLFAWSSLLAQSSTNGRGEFGALVLSVFVPSFFFSVSIISGSLLFPSLISLSIFLWLLPLLKSKNWVFLDSFSCLYQGPGHKGTAPPCRTTKQTPNCSLFYASPLG